MGEGRFHIDRRSNVTEDASFCNSSGRRFRSAPWSSEPLILGMVLLSASISRSGRISQLSKWQQRMLPSPKKLICSRAPRLDRSLSEINLTLYDSVKLYGVDGPDALPMLKKDGLVSIIPVTEIETVRGPRMLFVLEKTNCSINSVPLHKSEYLQDCVHCSHELSITQRKAWREPRLCLKPEKLHHYWLRIQLHWYTTWLEVVERSSKRPYPAKTVSELVLCIHSDPTMHPSMICFSVWIGCPPSLKIFIAAFWIILVHLVRHPQHTLKKWSFQKLVLQHDTCFELNASIVERF